MLYKDLVEVYEKLNETTKRLEKTYFISELLKRAPKELVKDITYLLQGRVFPPWDERKIGMSSMLIIKVITNVTGTSENEIKRLWKTKGDLGEVAKELVKTNKQTKLSSQKLTIKKVVDNIKKLPELTGEGTVNRKVSLISELLSNSSPTEAKYVVKTILEELRIGIAEGTMRDAIVWAFFPKIVGIFSRCEKCKSIMHAAEKCLECNNKMNTKFKEEIEKHYTNCLEIKSLDELKNLDKYEFVKIADEKLAREAYDKFSEEVQHAYNLSNDLGVVAENLKLHGIKSLEEVGIEVGTPINPMLAIPGSKLENIKEALESLGKPVLADFKLDGFRCVTGFTPIYSLNRGYISIKDLKKNDLVLTHKGNFKKVKNINTRTIDKRERLFELQTFFGEKIRISEGHKILVSRDEKEKWVPIEQINHKKDLAVFPIPRINEKSQLKNKLVMSDDSGYSKVIKVDNFFFRFLGFWIGDGFTNEYHHMERVGLLFNRKTENELADYYIKNIKQKFGIRNVTKSIQKNLIVVYFRDKPFRIWLSKHFRREWKGKKLPLWFLGINKNQFESFIKGYIESDGYTDKIGRTSITTKEKDLAMTVQIIALKFGKVYGISRVRIMGGTYYTVLVPRTNRYYRVKKGKVYISILRINELKRRDPRKRLYNLEIEGDKSYCTALISLHNCQIHKKGEKITLFTRKLENVTKQFPEIVELVKEHVKGESFILDSELVGYDPKTGKYRPFQEISQRIKRKYDIERMAKELPVEINIFDILYYNGKTMMNKPQSERRELIEKIVKPLKRKIVTTEKIISGDEKELEKFYDQALKAGVEGLILKSMDKEYIPGRKVGGWVKIKPTLEPLDLVIIGGTYGEGKRAHALSSFTLACKSGSKFLRCGMVGTGIKEKDEGKEGVTFTQLTKLLKPYIINEKGRHVDIKPVIVVEVGYEEIQKSPTYDSGFALRFPRVLRLRTEDKKSSQANTISDIEHIYKEQKKFKSKIK
ncbi:MAG: ATP-dependent DNA ligase [Nanoarchaeota archaeon]|nr:ATP-dependent DNA ligase [Nanoarchaeota archaeon]